MEDAFHAINHISSPRFMSYMTRRARPPVSLCPPRVSSCVLLCPPMTRRGFSKWPCPQGERHGKGWSKKYSHLQPSVYTAAIDEAGGVLRTITRLTLNLLLLRASV